MKLDTLFLLAKGLGLSEVKIGRIKKALAKSGEMTPEAAAELIGKELITPLKLRASINSETQPETDNPGEHGNPGNPGKPKCSAKVITEDELERYLEAGWDRPASSGTGRSRSGTWQVRSEETVCFDCLLGLSHRAGFRPRH